MVEILTSRPSVTLLSSLPSSLEEGLLSQTLLRLRIASFSHSICSKIWNFGNLKSRLHHLNDRLAIMICEIREGNIVVGHDGLMEMSVFLNLVSKSKARFMILLWSADFVEIAEFTFPDNVLLSSFVPPDGVSIYAVIAELLSLSWGTLSLIENPVQLSAVISITTRLLDIAGVPLGGNYKKLLGKYSSDLAWTEKDIFTDRVDYDKFLRDCRSEQKSDTLKRILDVESISISYHSSLQSRKARAQAMYWLLEVGELFEPGIFKLSSTYRLLSKGEDSIVEAARENVHATESLDPRRLIEFFESFVVIPSGSYPIGVETCSELSEPPSSPRLIELMSFRMLNRPITYFDWMTFCEPLRCWPNSIDDVYLPVVNVNVAEAMYFAQLVTKSLSDSGVLPLGSYVDLPSEELWEVAARGSEGRQYPWGDWFDSSRCNSEQVLGRTSKVFSFSPIGDSMFGCSDMAGNVREWTSSRVPAAASWANEVVGESVGLAHVSSTDRFVIRGGSYSYDSDCVRSWVRNTQVAARSDAQTGFRLLISGL